jgi:hypothetical protein
VFHYDGQTDIHDEAKSRVFAIFLKAANFAIFERTKTDASSYGQYFHLPLIFFISLMTRGQGSSVGIVTERKKSGLSPR